MISFIESSRAIQLDIMSLLILLFCLFMILQLQQNHHRAPFLHQFIGIASSAVYFSVFVLLIFVREHTVEGTEMPGFLKLLSSVPVLGYFVFLATGLLVVTIESIFDMRRFRSSISEYSILQAVNDLRDGLVIFDKNNRIVFVNKQMHKLAFDIFGQSLYCTTPFEEIIKKGFCAEDVHFLPQLAHPTYFLPDGEVWQIRELTITVDGATYSEFVASNITEQYLLRKQIEQENALLKERQRLIAESTKMVVENNVKEEQLAYKMRIHDSLGQCVATVSHIMRESGDVDESAKLWTQAVEGLRTFEDTTSKGNEQRALQEQLRLIKQLGCSVEHHGPMPHHSSQAQIFRDAIRTAAINAVHHANAGTLFVKTEKEGRDFVISISDNGRSEDAALTEGGGLSSLRQKVENAGGTMKALWDDGVKLHIVIPSDNNST